MNEQEIIEGNKTIAEFMGGKYARNENLTYEPKGCWENVEPNLFTREHPQDYDLKYHSSWDWLMPALIKAVSMNEYFYYAELRGDYIKGYPLLCFSTDGEDGLKFSLTYLFNHLVKYINWLNTQTK